MLKPSMMAAHIKVPRLQSKRKSPLTICFETCVSRRLCATLFFFFFQSPRTILLACNRKIPKQTSCKSQQLPGGGRTEIRKRGSVAVWVKLGMDIGHMADKQTHAVRRGALEKECHPMCQGYHTQKRGRNGDKKSYAFLRL